ncbi:hypothetical protein CHS0354_025645 [Potamilus streckersoni]|uniref:phenylalanine 4-monooxygenase n=1 Tax=Potamilus streckersoni TaxID=2493646 RepID=A0AAE0RYQ0_9BIVA|nr:hypothetical protein CHS0354_025645 [Potamilus streckersoni]
MDVEGTTSLVFSLKENFRGLVDALKLFQNHNVNFLHIESRQSNTGSGDDAFFVLCANKEGNLKQAINDLRTISKTLTTQESAHSHDGQESTSVPWFPKRRDEIDQLAVNILKQGERLQADHPGFSDEEYKARRNQIAEIANNYKFGLPIPRVDYTVEETNTWRTVFTELRRLYPEHACREFNQNFQLLTDSGLYTEDRVPQLEDVSNFLKNRTGFRLRPVSGLVSIRNFLAGLAFRVFHAMQYLRHPSQPMYSPEPDVCHELMGHVPLLADPVFARFIQEIGLASLGASAEDIRKLSRCFWFSVEYGLCKQDGETKVYGAGLLSQFGELQHYLTDGPELRPFEPSKAAEQTFKLTGYQPVYFEAQSFETAQAQMRAFASTIPRPFTVRYNAYTESIEIINQKSQIVNLVKEIKDDLDLLEQSLKVIE